jgi:hypothetical protein
MGLPGGTRGRVVALVVVIAFSLLVCAPARAAITIGDGTYMYAFERYGCKFLQAQDGTGRVEGSWRIRAWVNGGQKIRRFHLEAWVAGLSDNGQWVQFAGTKYDAWADGRYLTGKSTQPFTFDWYSTNGRATDITRIPSQVAMIYKISFRRYYGKGPIGFWKTKKKSADFIQPLKVSGNLAIGDTKHYVHGGACRTVQTGEVTTPSAANTRTAGASEASAPIAERRASAQDTEPAATLFGAAALAAETGLPDRSYEGIAAAEATDGSGASHSPPDPALAVGHDRVLVAGGGALNVLDPETGAPAGAARSIASLWQAHGGRCAAAAGVAPRVSVLYDEHADRFVAARAVPSESVGAQSRVCLAVSATGDPSGAWRTYDAATPASIQPAPAATSWRSSASRRCRAARPGPSSATSARGTA